MENDAVCRLEWPWLGGCLATTVLTVISVLCPLFNMVRPWRRNQHLFNRIYHQQSGLCLMAMDVLFLNLLTVLLCTLTTKTMFLQTTKRSRYQLQEMQTTCPAQTPPIIRSQKARSMTSSGISKFHKIRRTFGTKFTTEQFITQLCEKDNISRQQISENLYKIWCIRMNSWGEICRWKCTFHFHTWISFHLTVVPCATGMGSASIKTFRWCSTATKGNGALPC